ncbi:MAG: B12-binding domain-containing radical SAM protein [Firmicutes bacterium]|nr:B12-binding domain-containing radical SAM protein [Bacillota bacterium]
MKIILCGIDSKYIHSNLAIRYLKANTSYPTSLMEFTIKDSVFDIVQQILNESPDMVGFSTYIWNIQMIQEITLLLKEKSEIIVLWGGPECSFDEFYFMKEYPVDFIIRGEGEHSFHRLLEVMHTRSSYDSVPGLTYREDDQILSNPIQEIRNLNQLKSPYLEMEDPLFVSSKINYVETSRGCPFHCSYCLASLEKSVRFFDLERVKKELLHLMSLGGKTFKFLDRTFNASPKYAIGVFDFLIEHYKNGISFQFEITGDILKREIIDYLNKYAPPHLFRFEIGVQSTNSETNLAVDRIQDNDILFENIIRIKNGGIVDMHLDLIAGLPLEDVTSFKKTFNEVFSLYAKELQLGFLKMLRGTPIRLNSNKYGYVYDHNPPYEIRKNDSLSEKDIEIIHQVEEMVEIFWNKGFMNSVIEKMTKKSSSAFDFFQELYEYLMSINFNPHRYQLFELFLHFHQFVTSKYPEDEVEILSMLKKEYLSYHKIKPKIWWKSEFENRNQILREVHELHPEYRIDDLYKYGVITQYFDKILLVLYFPNNTITIEYNK